MLGKMLKLNSYKYFKKSMEISQENFMWIFRLIMPTRAIY